MSIAGEIVEESIVENGVSLYLGDSVKILSSGLIPKGSVNLIFADPPYNIKKKFAQGVISWPSDEKYVDWCKTWLDSCIDLLADNGSFYLMGATQFMPYLDIYLREKIEIKSRIIWSYDSSGVQAKSHYGSMYEPIFFMVKNPKNYDLELEDMIEFGASPRASIWLILAAKAHALLAGRGFVIPDDIKSVAHDVLRHRIILTFEAEAEGNTSDAMIDKILEKVRAP